MAKPPPHDSADAIDQALMDGVRHHQSGDLAAAEILYRQVLDRDPDNPDALNMLGSLFMQRGEGEAGLPLLERSAALRPDPGVLSNLGGLLAGLGRHEDSVDALRRAVALAPDLPQALYNLGRSLFALGRAADAVDPLSRAAHLMPGDAAVHAAHGAALAQRGDVTAAIDALSRAAALTADDPWLHLDLARLQIEAGRPGRATPAIVAAVAASAGDAAVLAAASRCLETLSFSRPDAALTDAIRRCLDSPGTAQRLARPTLSLLAQEPEIAELLHRATTGDDAAVIAFWRGGGRGIADNSLFRSLLRGAVLRDRAFEILFAASRRALLAIVRTDGGLAAALRDIAADLARQCHENEFAYAESAAETEALADLEADLRRVPAAAAVDHLIIYAMYRSIAELLDDGSPAADAWRVDALADLIAEFVDARRLERHIAGELDSMAAVEDPVSKSVRAQYEENPYPRWTTLDVGGPPQPLDVAMRRLFPDLPPAPPRTAPPAVLIAGCGTGRQALEAATRYAGADVVALDLSRASLPYGARKAAELDIENVRFVHGDILGLAADDRNFDVIECVGVLHHMADPLRSWRILVDRLAADGYMKIGLYSERARQPVLAARRLIEAEGYPSTSDGVRRLRQRMIAEGPNNEAFRRILAWSDFYTLSECRDLLFHVCEHRFTLPDIAAALDSLELDFVGFRLPPTDAAVRYRARFPEDHALRDLACWDRFEADNPETFLGMYQFWVRRADW